MRKPFRTGLLIISGMAGSLWADGSYQRTTRITGGAAVQLANNGSPFSSMIKKNLPKPETETFVVRGNQMVSMTNRGSTIWDLDKGTMTMVDSTKQEYSVMTMQEMAELTKKFAGKMSDATSQLNDQTNPDAPKFTSDLQVQPTGAVKQINGVMAKETILTLKVKMTDTKSGQSLDTVTTLDVWKADGAIPGYDDVQAFYRRMGEKWSSLSSNREMAAAFKGVEANTQGIVDLYREAGKIKGVSILEITRTAMAMPASALAANATPTDSTPGAGQQTTGQQPANSQQSSGSTPTNQAGNAATTQASDSVSSKLGAVGSLLGHSGLGGFGRKKSTQTTQSTPAPTTTETTSQPANGAPLDPLSTETTTELSNFSKEAVTNASFQVPAGYKQVPSPLMKMMQ